MIARRTLQVVVLALCAFAGTILGATGVALGTKAGRSIVVGAVLEIANNAINGRLTIGEVTGSLTRGLEARDVTILGRDSAVFASVPHLTLRYRLRDFLSGRIVLGQVLLERPAINVIQHPNGRFNYQEILRLGGPSTGAVKPLVAFSDVVLDSATLIVRTRAGKGDTARFEFVPELEGGHRVRRFERIFARLSYLRISSPLPGEDAIVADIEDLRTRISDPAIVVRSAKGRVEQAGDSVDLDLSPFLAGTSKAKLRGIVSWPRDTMLFNLEVETRDALLDDLRPIVPIIPKGLDATGTFRVRSLAGDVLAIGARDMMIVARRGGGTFTGNAGMTLGPWKTWSVSKAELAFDNLDLEYVRPFLDTLPLAGRMTGTLEADGPRDHLTVESDVVFRDSLVPGWPVSTVEGGGVLSLGSEAGAVFQGFEVRNSQVDLGTVRRLLPAVALRGMLQAQGILSGPWLESQFTGTLHHADAPFPATIARGVIQVDARGDTLGVWADLELDSLRLAGLWTSYPGFRLLGDFAGNLQIEGYANALHVTADLSGVPGRLTGDALLVIMSPRFGARDINLQFRSIDIRGLYPQPIPSALNGSVRGRIELDTLVPPVAAITIELDTSSIGGSPVDGGYAELRAADSLIQVDTVGMWAENARLTARGALGLRRPRFDSVRVTAVFDSVKALEPLLSGWLELPEDTLRQSLGGVVTLTGTVRGALDEFELVAEGSAPRVRWGSFSLASGVARATWSSSRRGRLDLLARADSMQYGALGFALLVAEATGRRDSLSWQVRGRNGPEAEVVAGGGAILDSAETRIAVDSARLALPSVTWSLSQPTAIIVKDSAIDVGTVILRDAGDSSKVEMVGTIPVDGHGRLSVSIEALPLRDIYAMLQKESRLVQGKLGGTIDIAGTARAPQMTSSLVMTDVALNDFRVARIEGLVDYAAQRLQGAFTLRRGNTILLGIEADLPIDLALRGVQGRRQLPGSLSIRAIADSADLALVEAITPVVRQSSGRLDGDFGIIGTWERPQLSGTLTVSDGAASFPGLGVRHEGLAGRLVMRGDTLQIERLSLRSGGGTLNVTGNMRLARLTEPVLDIRFVARDFFAMQARNFVTATATGQFNLSGPMIGATFSGDGTVTRGTLYFTDLVNKRIVNLEDSLFRSVIDTTLVRRQGLGRAFQNRFIDSLVVDSLSLEMGSEVWLRSTEANIQLAGAMVFNKIADQYRVTGVLSTPRGTYQLPLVVEFATREFTVTRGQIRFLGTPDLNALLDIDAEYVLRRRVGTDVNIFVHIGGTLYAPTITLSSDIQPPLPEAEIISYLLFGAPLNTVPVDAQGRQALAQGIASALSGQLENFLLANLGSPITPDYLQITPGGSVLYGTQVQFGWQLAVMGLPMFLAPTTQFGCQKGFTPRDDIGVSLEFRLSKEFRVAGSIEPVRGCNANAAAPGGVNRQAGVDLLWEKNY